MFPVLFCKLHPHVSWFPVFLSLFKPLLTCVSLAISPDYLLLSVYCLSFTLCFFHLCPHVSPVFLICSMALSSCVLPVSSSCHYPGFSSVKFCGLWFAGFFSHGLLSFCCQPLVACILDYGCMDYSF